MVFSFSVSLLLIACGIIPQTYEKSKPSISASSSAEGESLTSPQSGAEPSIAASPEVSQSSTEDFLLRMKKSGVTYQVDGCIVDAFSIIDEESNFPDQNAIALAKENVYASELLWEFLLKYFAC